MSQTETFRISHPWIMFGITVVASVFIWGMTWQSTQSEIGALKANRSDEAQRYQRLEQGLHSLEKAFVELRTDVKYIRETLKP